ncbi:MAG: M13 family metallopeptidase [Hylemonella sp.]|nr:M13 family metallopeptidase [Hylemonella sp.]
MGLLAGTLLVLASSPQAQPAAPELGYSAAHMDRSISPRKDFYRYANGAWLRSTQIPPSEADVGGFTQLAANLDQKLSALIHEAAASKAPRGSPRQQIGDYYRAAMDTARLDALGLQPLAADLQRLEAINTPAERGAVSARLALGYGISPLVNAFSTVDAKNSAMNVLLIHPSVQQLEPGEYNTPAGQRVRELYQGFVTRMLQAAGDSPADAARKAQAIVAMEAELAAARLTPLQMRDPDITYNKLPFAEVQALVPSVDLNALLAGLGVPAPETAIVMDVNGLKAVHTLLSTRTTEEVRTLLAWHVLSSRASALGRPWSALDEEFNKQRKGLQALPTRERQVTQAITAQLSHPMAQLYVQAHFPESTRREITEMVGHIKDEFTQRLRTNPWLDEPTRAAALAKLDKVDIQVGYPQNWIDFSAVAIRADDYYGNQQRLAEFALRRELAKVGQPVVQERFVVGPTLPTSVNAAYNPQANTIDITAAIVQPPFYKPGADAAVNYCTIGAVIGHELTHGFDSNGRRYGPAGNLRDWWTLQASAEFQKRTDMLVRQYSQFTILPGLKHNGLLTLTENIADLGGITLAHAALHRALKGQPQPRIDGLTTDQRCFVAWSQMWAYKGRPERLRFLVARDYHANSRLRSFVPLLHLDAFHQAFGTRPGDPMWRAPEQRVAIW